MTTLTAVAISPDDLLDAARTIPLGDISTCDWLARWIPATTLVEWAKRGLQEADSYGLSNALTYAKRAAACRIDLLLQYNHLFPLSRATYPAKIAGLRLVDLTIPDVVHELVIHPRNALEHDYEPPDRGVARRAVDVAELFVRATESEYERSSIVAVGWNVMGSHALTPEGEYVNFREFGDKPMLFIDIFGDPHAAKIVDPKNGEIRLAELASFSERQTLTLAQLLRSNYSARSLSRHGSGLTYFKEMKRQGGF